MNHDDLGNYSHSYVADLRAQLQAANERADKAEAEAKTASARFDELIALAYVPQPHGRQYACWAQTYKQLWEFSEASAQFWRKEYSGLDAEKLLSIAIMRSFCRESQIRDGEILAARLAASEQTSAALKAEVDRLLHERNEIAEKSVLPYRDQLNALVREAEKVVVERDAARALNDTLAGAAQEAHAALVSIRADRPTAHTDEVWFMLNRAINTTDAALSAYAKSKEAQP